MTELKQVPLSAQELAEKQRKDRLIQIMLDDLKPIKPYLDDPAVTDIAVQDSGEIIISKFGQGRIFTGLQMSDISVYRIIKAVAAVSEVKVDAYSSLPKLEAFIPGYNARITGLLPNKVIRPVISIRKPAKEIYTLEQYVANGQMTEEQRELIVKHIEVRNNIIVSGQTGCGKTTLTNAIIRQMEIFTPNANFYIVEDVPELQCSARMKTTIFTDKYTADEAVEEALRFNPDRIIFGEVRNAKIMNALVTAWNTGHKGSVTTIHANNCMSTLTRIKKLLSTINADTMDDLSEIIQLVVHLSKTSKGIIVDEILEVKEQTNDLLNLIEQNSLA